MRRPSLWSGRVLLLYPAEEVLLLRPELCRVEVDLPAASSVLIPRPSYGAEVVVCLAGGHPAAPGGRGRRRVRCQLGGGGGGGAAVVPGL